MGGGSSGKGYEISWLRERGGKNFGTWKGDSSGGDGDDDGGGGGGFSGGDCSGRFFVYFEREGERRGRKEGM